MKRCPRCALPETFPGIEFHETEGCNYCVYHSHFSKRQQRFREQLKAGFEAVVEQARQTRGNHHAILCYSGGKDSTFLLHLLRTVYKLDVLSYTMDNGFISPQALRNVATIVDKLGVDHIFVRPRSDLMKRMFREALTNKELYTKAVMPYGSATCMSCLSMVMGIALRMGREKRIPLVVIGFTPGQIADVGMESFVKTGSTMYFARTVGRDDPFDFAKMVRDPLYEHVGEEVDRYLIPSQYLAEGEEEYPRVLYPYHAMVDYDEQQIRDTIAQYGWVAPRDTDACSTNCRINSVGIAAHVKQHGYHPYIAEMSQLVREGRMTYDEAIAREAELASDTVIKDVIHKLQFHPSERPLGAEVEPVHD
jgi:hypothetical protein